MGTNIILTVFAIICSWAILRTIGSERQRRLQNLRPAPPPQQPSAAPTPSFRKAA